MIHLVYSPKFCISSFSLSLGTTVISRRNENNLYDILFFGGRGGGGRGGGGMGWRDKQGVFLGNVKVASSKTLILKLTPSAKPSLTI